MKTRTEIVETLAKAEVVETMIRKITRVARLTPDLQDLAQSVYLILLEYDEDKIIALAEDDAIRFFIARVILTQYKGNRTTFYHNFVEYRRKAYELTRIDYETKADGDR